MRCAGLWGAEELGAAADLGARLAGSVGNWPRNRIVDGGRGLVPKKGSARDPGLHPQRDIPDDPELLRCRRGEPELKSAVMKGMRGVLKVDPRASAGDLATGPGKYAELRRGIARRLAGSRGRCGDRRIAAEKGLVARCVGKRMRYSSYGGEIAEDPPNMLAREFGAPVPSMRWPAGIAEMGAADGKACLSPATDLPDGMIAVRPPRSPNALLADMMPGRSIPPRCPGELARPSAPTGARITAGAGGSTSRTGTARRGRCRGRRAARTTPLPRGSPGGSGSRCTTRPAGRGGRRPSLRRSSPSTWIDNRERIKVSLGGMSPCNHGKSLGLSA